MMQFRVVQENDRSCPAKYHGAIRGVVEFEVGLGRIAQQLLRSLLWLWSLRRISFFPDTQSLSLCAK